MPFCLSQIQAQYPKCKLYIIITYALLVTLPFNPIYLPLSLPSKQIKKAKFNIVPSCLYRMEKSCSKYFNKHQTMKNVKEYSWDNNYGDHHQGGDLVGGFLWPPRSYTCSFCKREFKSAQALGGHMNVHRRDRARLRLQSSSPPTILESNPNPNPNSNPSFVSSPSSPSRKFFPPFVSTLPPLLSPNSFSSSTAAGGGSHEMIKNGDLTKMGCAKFEKNGKECSEVVKRGEFLRLDLGIGLISESKDDLDLELRLGYI